MERRDFIALLGGAVSAPWPFMARAQQTTPVIGFLRSASLADATNLINAFREGLREIGYIEGQNVVIEYRSAENDPERLTVLTIEFVRRPVALIVGNVLSALAAKAATATIPIVFATGTDPVRDGRSWRRPRRPSVSDSPFPRLLLTETSNPPSQRLWHSAPVR